MPSGRELERNIVGFCLNVLASWCWQDVLDACSEVSRGQCLACEGKDLGTHYLVSLFGAAALYEEACELGHGVRPAGESDQHHERCRCVVASLGKTKGPETVRYAHRVFCLVLDFGMRTRRLSHNVARGVRLPARPPSRERILTMAQVEALASRLDREGDIVLAMALLGLRWSELAALTVSDVDLDRGRARVVERATEVGGRMDVSAPKSRASARSIGIPPSMREVLEARTAGRPADALVFPAPDGGYLRNGNWRHRSGWMAALKATGLEGVTPHDLRRTFGSLARKAGADLRYIQRAMGHESITTTARIYAHLYDDELDEIAVALDGLRGAQP